MKKFMYGVIAFLFGAVMPLMAQQPQTSDAPIYAVNAKYVNGVAPGYYPTPGAGLTLNIGGGTSFCNNTIVQYTAGTLSLTASSTNYVYLDKNNTCAPTASTSVFTSSTLPVAIVTTSGSAIISIVDVRTSFTTATGGGGGGVSGLTQNFFPIAQAGGDSLQNSQCDQNVTNANALTCAQSLGAYFTSIHTYGSGGGSWSAAAGTAPSGVLGYDVMWMDSSTLRLSFNPNNAGAVSVVGIAAQGTANHIPAIAANGYDVKGTNITTDSTGNNITVPGTYGNLPRSYDVVADGGAICTGSSNNDGPAIQAIITAHPGNYITFPKGSNCYSTQSITIGETHLSGGGSNYGATAANPLASTVQFAQGFGFNANGTNGSIEKLNVLGSAPSGSATSNAANIIFPSGSILTELTYGATYITVTSGSVTLALTGAQTLLPNGIVVLSNFPAPYTALNGLPVYLTSQCPSINAPCQILNAGWIQFTNVWGFTPVARTSLASGTVQLGTTGQYGSTGVYITASGVTLRDLYIADFDRNGIEVNGTSIADDPIIDNVWVNGNRMDGYWAHGGDSNAEIISNSKFYANDATGIFDTTFLHGSHYTPQASYNHYGAINWAASMPGTQFAVSCARVSQVVTCTGTGLPYIIGQGVILTSMTDATLDAQVVANGIITSVSGFLSSASSTSITFTQPTYTTSLADTTGTGFVQLGSVRQIMTGSAIRGGAYWIDGSNGAANILASNMYDEGGQYQGDPNGTNAGNFMGGGVIQVGGHFGDLIDSSFLPGLQLQAGSSGASISPFTSTYVGTSSGFNRYFRVGSGCSDSTSNSFYCLSDNLGGSGDLYDVGLDLRLTDPGQLDNLYEMRTTFNSDESGFYNDAILYGGGGNKYAGATSTIGTATFTGSGLNDLTSGGTSTTSANVNYLVDICGTGTPDKYCWFQGNYGPVGTVAIHTACGGVYPYQAGDTTQLRSDDGGNDFADIVITSVDGSGCPTSVAVSFPGLQFLPATNQITPGTGGANEGAITISSVSNGGSGWNVSDTFNVFGGNIGTLNAYGHVTGVTAPNGAITSYVLDYKGGPDSYAVRTKGTTPTSCASSSCTGFVINITQVSGAGLTLDILTLKGMSGPTNIASGANALSNGVTATWAATTGHTVADFWVIPVTFAAGIHPFIQIPGNIAVGSGLNRINWTMRVNNTPQTVRPDGSSLVEGDVGFNYSPTLASGCVYAWQTDSTGNNNPIACRLSGLTGTITGTSLSASCDSGTATVTGAVVGDPVIASTTDGTDVGGAFYLRASVTAANTVTVYVCGTGTPSSKAYNVRVFP